MRRCNGRISVNGIILVSCLLLITLLIGCAPPPSVQLDGKTKNADQNASLLQEDGVTLLNATSSLNKTKIRITNTVGTNNTNSKNTGTKNIDSNNTNISTLESPPGEELLDNSSESFDDSSDDTSSASPDRVDITLGDGKKQTFSTVIATIDGKTEKFTVPDTDRDAVVFDVAQHYGKPMKSIRTLAYIDGIAYLRPSERVHLQEAVSTFNDKDVNPDSIPIIAEKDEGFIRAVGCDYNKRIIRLGIKNIRDETIFLYRDVRPRIKGALAISLNNKVLTPLSCGNKDSIEPGKVLDCIKSNVFFTGNKPHISTAFNENATVNEGNSDTVVGMVPGYQERIDFICPQD